MPFTFHELEIPGPLLVEPRVFPDERGSFHEAFKASDFRAASFEAEIVQVNESVSTRGVIRALHYQIHPSAQGKLVRVSEGRLQDVAVDIRPGSDTLGEHVSVELSAANHRLLWIPPGFAHGACALEESTRLVYLVTGGEYAPEAERGIHPFDEQLGIEWQVPAAERRASERDLQLPPFSQALAELEAMARPF